MGENDMKTLADALWGYFKEKYLIPYLSDSVCYFQATVTTAPSGGVIGVQRPFDNAITLPYAWSASTLSVGDQCTVLMFGDMSNCIVIGDGMLDEPGIYVTKAGLLGSTGQATDNTMTQKAISDALSALQPAISGAAGQYVGFDANGDPEAQDPDTTPTDGSTALITSDGVYDALTLKAPLASPDFTGTPTAPTAVEGTSTTQIATTEFVTTAIKKYSLTFTTADWIELIPSGYFLPVNASVHGCGTDFIVDVYIADGSYYKKYYGYPSEGWVVSVNSDGDVRLRADSPFDGKIVIR